MKSINTKYIIIHGFGGGVHEITPLADVLRGIGKEIICPVLNGAVKCISSEYVKRNSIGSRISYTQWIESVEKEVIKFQESGDDIFLIGFSMGGLIALDLACKYKIKSIITINTPIYYWNIYQIILNISEDIKSGKNVHFKRYWQAKRESTIYSLRQFLKLLGRVKPKLNNVNCSVFIIQTINDDTVKKKSAKFIYDNISSETKSIKYFEKGGHLVLLDPMAENVIEYTINLIDIIV